MLRVVPEVETDTHHAVATGHADQKFGLTLDEAREAIERLGAAGWADLQGIHMHIGSQLFDLEPYREAIAAIAALGAFDALRPRRRARRRLHRRAPHALDRRVGRGGRGRRARAARRARRRRS